ncbi:MAG TPA: hypothetical protein VJM80_00810 [bacterium]|nr:hypothetical protein [bacterium]
MQGTAPSDGLPLYLDAHGDWFDGPDEITHPGIRRYLYEHLTFDPGQGFMVRNDRQARVVEVEDVPFAVLRTTPRLNSEGSSSSYTLLLSDECEEVLDPGTLHWGERNILYCHVKGRAFRARFSRPAYLQLAWRVEEDPESGNFYLPAGNQKHYL